MENKKKSNKTSPLTKEEDVQKNPDPKIDQDFPGFPHLPSDKKNIKPSTEEDKKSAGVRSRRNNK